MSYDGRSRSVPPTTGRDTGVASSPPSARSHEHGRCRRRRPRRCGAATRSPRSCASSSRAARAGRSHRARRSCDEVDDAAAAQPPELGVRVARRRRTRRRWSPARRCRPPDSGTGAPPTVIRTRSMPGTWRSVHASWSTPRESSLGEARSTSRESGTSATPLSVTTTDRSRSVREGSAERLISASAGPGPGEQAADQVGRRLLAARDEHRVGQQHPAGLVVEVEVEPREAAVEERGRHDEGVDRVVDAPLAVLGDQPEVEGLRAPGRAAAPAATGVEPAGVGEPHLGAVAASASTRERLVDDRAPVGLPGRRAPAR